MMIMEKEKTIIRIRQSHPIDVYHISNNMRKSDRDEIWASNKITGLQALDFGMKYSSICFSAERNGNPMAMFGVVPFPEHGEIASVWMLGTDDLDKSWLTLGKKSKKIVNYFLRFYPVLFNYVDVRNEKTIAWLEWLGAEFDAPKPHGALGLNFRYFYFVRG